MTALAGCIHGYYEPIAWGCRVRNRGVVSADQVRRDNLFGGLHRLLQRHVRRVEQNRVVVEGVNYVTKHVKVGQTQRGSKTGGLETHEAPIHVSNVALVDPETKKPTRVGFRQEQVTKDGVTKTVRVRYAKKSGKDL